MLSSFPLPLYPVKTSYYALVQDLSFETTDRTSGRDWCETYHKLGASSSSGSSHEIYSWSYVLTGSIDRDYQIPDNI